METTKRVFEIRQKIDRIEEKVIQTMIFDKTDEGWVYVAPNQQKHTQEQVEEILTKLKELNEENLK